MSELPFEFPLRSLPGNIWPPLPGGRTAVWNAYLELCRSESYTPKQLKALQRTQLKELLRYARAQVPYYRAAFAGLPSDIDLLDAWHEVPLLSRASYQTDAAGFVAEALPKGTLKTGVAHTAGSSGIAVTVQQTNMVQLWWQALNLRDLRWSRVDVRGSLAAIRYYGANEKQKKLLANGVTLPNWNDQLKELMQTGPSHALDIHQEPEKQLRWLAAKKPDYLISYPSNLAVLARLALDAKMEFPSIRAVLCVSEVLTEDDRLLIEGAFSAPTRNTYSCMEAGYLASQCPRGQGLHVHSENVLLEILDDEGRPTPRGELGRVVITPLRNFLTPLIRYEIMDQAAFAAEPCGCGIGLPLIEPPLGKRHPLFVLPSGKRKNSMGLAVGMRKIGGMVQFRIRQESRERVSVRVYPGQSWSSEHEMRVISLLQEFFEAPVQCDVAMMQELELSPAGKAGHLECQVDHGIQ